MIDFVTAAEKPSPSHSSSTLAGTVAVVDMVGYSSIAKLLQENINAESVAELNRQIYNFVARSLEQFSNTQTFRVVAPTGDGAIVLFQHAEDAHHFGVHLHLYAHEHTGKRSLETAERWFRVGMATGEVNVTSAPDRSSEYAGIAIANAVRLEGAAKAGEIVVDEHTFAKLSSETQALYAAEEVVHGKREERFRVRRCRVTGPAAKTDKLSMRPFTRRQVLRLSTAAVAVAAGGSWLEWPRVERILEPILHPLPEKRFVALMAWPAAAPESAALIESVLASIHRRVRRAERHIHNLVILDPSDMSQGAAAIDPDHTHLAPRELAALWGATMVLAASMERKKSSVLLDLKLLDAQLANVLRWERIAIEPDRIESANEAASRSATQLLELPPQDERITDEEEFSGFPAAAQQLLIQGRAFGNRPNDTGLADAIETYQDAVAKYPNFALASAELGKAYLRQFLNTYDVEFINLAGKNLALALNLNPNSVRARLGQGELLAEKGQFAEASRQVAAVLAGDTDNADALFLKGRISEKAGNFSEAETAYTTLTQLRPNYWRGYNNLGVAQHQQAKYDAAIRNFNTAAHIAQRIALPIANLGVLYNETGKREEAKESLQHSLALAPNEVAFSALGDIAWEEKDYAAAHDYFAKANNLEPRNHITWSDLGDTCKVLGMRDGEQQEEKKRWRDEEKRCFAKAADLLSVLLEVNPANGPFWMTLGLYHARLGDPARAETDIQRAEQLKASDLDSLFTKARALAAMGRTEKALWLVIYCLDNGLSPLNVDLAVEMDKVRQSPQYKAHADGIKQKAT